MVKKNLSKKYCPQNTFCFDSIIILYFSIYAFNNCIFFISK